jgi:hypothetical protein
LFGLKLLLSRIVLDQQAGLSVLGDGDVLSPAEALAVAGELLTVAAIQIKAKG